MRLCDRNFVFAFRFFSSKNSIFFLTNETRSIKRNAIASKFVYEVYYV